MEGEDRTGKPVMVSGTKFCRGYVNLIRYLFADQKECEEITVTALGNAISSAVLVAHLIEDAGVASIGEISTSYNANNMTYEDGKSRKITRITLVLHRNKDWVPQEEDFVKDKLRSKNPRRYYARETEEA